MSAFKNSLNPITGVYVASINGGDDVTHPSHKLKVTISFGDQLSIEGPGEGNIKYGITGDLAGQHNALTHDDLHVHRPLDKSGWI